MSEIAKLSKSINLSFIKKHFSKSQSNFSEQEAILHLTFLQPKFLIKMIHLLFTLKLALGGGNLQSALQLFNK